MAHSFPDPTLRASTKTVFKPLASDTPFLFQKLLRTPKSLHLHRVHLPMSAILEITTGNRSKYILFIFRKKKLPQVPIKDFFWGG